MSTLPKTTKNREATLQTGAAMQTEVGMQNKVETQALLFDMDGVLLSSIASVVRCWREWARMYCIPGAETFKTPHGMRAVDIVRSLLPDRDAEGVQSGLRAIEDLELADLSDLQVLPGVKTLLEHLPVERWAIVTSATERLLLGRLQAAGLPVPARLISANSVVHGKPHPEPYVRGAELLGFRPEECIVVEDAPSGISAGKAAGCRVLAVLGTHPAEDLRQADWILPSLTELTFSESTAGLELTFLSI